MRKLLGVFFALMLLACSAQAQDMRVTRALLVACSDFVMQEDLGAATSGNLHMIGSALISADISLGNLSIEDGTIGTPEALGAAITEAFSDADEDDLSIFYLCTHGVLSSSDDNQVYLLLGDGETESPLSAQMLYSLLRSIQGEKLLILDACYSGALIGRGQPETGMLPGARHEPPALLSPFLLDSSMHVLTSSSGSESSWYYDSEELSSGAVSYFASALSSGLGLYGSAEADLSGDGAVSLLELQRYLSVAVPSSSCQLLSTDGDSLFLPVAQNAMLSRPLMDFSYGTSLLRSDDPVLDFSFTVTRDGTSVQYRLVDYADGSWDWDNAKTFLDEGDDGSAVLGIGRKHRALSLDGVLPDDSGFLMLQVFSVYENEVLLCSERLIAMQPETMQGDMTLLCRDSLHQPGRQELPIDVKIDVPAELTLSVHSADGTLVRRLAASQLTRPSADSLSHFYWDGRDMQGNPVSAGTYTITAETRVGARRMKALAEVSVGMR